MLTPEVRDKLREEARIEQRLNIAGVLENLAAAHFKLGSVDEAAALLAEAKPYVDALPSDVGLNRRAAAWVLSGAIGFERDDLRQALLDFRTGGAIAQRAGNARLQLMALENRKGIVAFLGEVDLAHLLQDRIERLRAHVPGQHAGLAELDMTWGADERSASFETLLKRMSTEVRRGAARLDEVLYSLWCVVDSVPSRAAALRDALAAVSEADAAALPHDARALIGIARHTLAETDDRSLLDGVPHALTAWFADVNRPDRVTTFAEAGLILHPQVREAVELLARRWAQAGVSQQRAGGWDEAFRQFTVGGAAFALAGNRDEAIRALLYSTDALARLDKTMEASSLLEYLGQDAGPALTADVLTRRLRTLAQAVADDTLDPRAALDEAVPVMRRIERLGDSTAIGVASLTLANLCYWADDRDAAVKLARRAERLMGDEAHRAVAREAIAQFTVADVDAAS